MPIKLRLAKRKKREKTKITSNRSELEDIIVDCGSQKDSKIYYKIFDN